MSGPSTIRERDAAGTRHKVTANDRRDYNQRSNGERCSFELGRDPDSIGNEAGRPGLRLRVGSKRLHPYAGASNEDRFSRRAGTYADARSRIILMISSGFGERFACFLE